MIEVDQTGISPNHSSRHGARIRLYVLHTQQGRGDAYSLARYLQQPSSGVTYHYSCDNFTNVDVVDTDRASWSVLDANPYTVNFCFAGSFAEMTRNEWSTKFGNAIQESARIFVQDGRKYGFDNLYTVDWDQIARGMSGATDHHGITKGLRIGSHTDVGQNFPWDVFAAWIAHYRGDSPPVVDVPVPNAIAAKRAVSEWLGDKLTEAIELPTPDGRGRYAEYEHGHIYWTPEYGAHPIPEELFITYTALGWETGSLGYPVGDHSELEGGLVQSFERGTLYRKTGKWGFYVAGPIGERWKRAGFQEGLLGWPVSNQIPFDSGAYQQFDGGRIYWAPEGTLAVLSAEGDDVPLSDRAQYIPTVQERKLMPVDGMRGGISYFGGPDDRSTHGRKMGISGEPADNPADPWYCAMRFGYCEVQPDPVNRLWVKPVAGTSDFELKAYLPNRRLRVANPANGRAVVVRPADWGPGAWAVPSGPKYRVVDVSQQAMRSLDAVTDSYVEVEWVDPATPLGPEEGN
ncbi:hypothetical protein [Rhodococcus marinonascens]|uniref:hypothetical protein n=1 Tax=Rhodococcus marinonascens TaxID=38311 RepID=UPI000934E3CE|nr:hypothetical protein [Rhodococcus marinonascens]